ncbi:MAG: hypothetical protein ACI9JN_000038 [Bacteroidia bacterium]|jgi:hypothetical protein
MKNLPLSLVIFLFGVSSLTSCISNCDKTVYYYTKIPVYGSFESIRNSFEVLGVQPMDSIDRIIELDHAYFLQEKGKGIHVISKPTTSLPTRTSFISVPGCLSIEGQGNTIYVGQATDLIIIDVSDLNNMSKTKVVRDIFNEEFVKQDSFITDYKYEYIERLLENTDCADGYIYPENTTESFSTSQGPHVDFHITKDHLITADNAQLRNFLIGITGTLTFKQSMNLVLSNRAGEILVSSSDTFIVVGSPTKNMILLSNDGALSRINGTSASSPFTCGKFFMIQNAIFYPDFSDHNNPNCNSNNMLIVVPLRTNVNAPPTGTFSFTEPQYVSTIESKMLLCDGAGGLAMFDVSNPPLFNSTVDILDELPNIHSKVSVMSAKFALVWGAGGLFYINVSDPRNIFVISKIE